MLTGSHPTKHGKAPIHYYDLYGSREDREPICLNLPYGSLKDEELEERLPSVKANYAGLVTLVDTWFGRLVDTIDRLGLRENTLIIFLADHGTNFAENPDKATGKTRELHVSRHDGYSYDSKPSIRDQRRHNMR